jgi:peptidase M28-like protein
LVWDSGSAVIDFYFFPRINKKHSLRSGQLDFIFELRYHIIVFFNPQGLKKCFARSIIPNCDTIPLPRADHMTISKQTPYEILENSILSKPRMMGTPAEKATTTFLLDYLRNHGLAPYTEEIEWSTAKVRGRKAMYLMAAIYVLLLNLSFYLPAPFNAFISIALAVLSVASVILFGRALENDKFKFLGTSAAGKNVLCDIEPAKSQEDAAILYFTAHSDSVASNMPKLYIKLIVGILTAYIVIVIQTVTSGVDFLIGYFNHSVAGAPVSGTITNDVFFFSLLLYVLIFISMFTRRVNTSPGACDNGSGSAILLSLAAHYKEHPAQNLHMKFCWFAAEEWGLYGSKHYVADHKDEIVAQKDNSYLINVDMVGTELAYLDKAGMFIKKPINRKLNKLIVETAKEAGIQVRPFKSPMGNNSDHAPFRKLKMEVAFFLAKKDTKRIHSPKDSLEQVRPEKLDDAVRLIMGVVEKL